MSFAPRRSTESFSMSCNGFTKPPFITSSISSFCHHSRSRDNDVGDFFLCRNCFRLLPCSVGVLIVLPTLASTLRIIAPLLPVPVDVVESESIERLSSGGLTKSRNASIQKTSVLSSFSSSMSNVETEDDNSSSSTSSTT